MRKEKLENLTVIGKIEGKRSKERQRNNLMESISSRMTKQVPAREKTQMAKQALLSATKERERWRGMMP